MLELSFTIVTCLQYRPLLKIILSEYESGRIYKTFLFQFWVLSYSVFVNLRHYRHSLIFDRKGWEEPYCKSGTPKGRLHSCLSIIVKVQCVDKHSSLLLENVYEHWPQFYKTKLRLATYSHIFYQQNQIKNKSNKNTIKTSLSKRAKFGAFLQR